MSDYLSLPCEILDAFVEELGAQRDVKALKACAQTCQRFLPIARRHLFSSLLFLDNVFEMKRRNDATEAFNEILSKNPNMATYVHELHWRIHSSDFDNENLIHLISRFKDIQVLHLRTSFGFGQSWDRIPASLQKSLIHLLQQDSLEQLNISWFKNIPVGILAGCSSRLSNLEIQNVQITDDQTPLKANSHSAKLTPQSLHIPEPTQANASVISAFVHSDYIDFSLLKRLTIPLGGQEERPSAQELLKLTQALESLTLVFPGKNLDFDGTSEVLKECPLPSMSSLTIKGGRTFAKDLSLVLICLRMQLKSLPRLPIKEFTFTISTGLENGWNPLVADQNEWCHLLAPFLSTSSFPALQKVSVVFEIGANVDTALFRASMDNLMKRDFEKLLEKRKDLLVELDTEVVTKLVTY